MYQKIKKNKDKNDKMHIKSSKNLTKLKNIENMEDSEYLYVALGQNIGQSANENVKKGDRVRQYEVIGDIQGFVSSYVHSPVSGEIIGIEEQILSNGKKSKVVIIKNDFKYEKIEIKKRKIDEVLELDKENILEIIKKSGIVGEGGAQFPTYVKYSTENKKIDTLILNGAECEPYLTSDYSVMNIYTKEFFEGIKIVNKLLEPKEIVIGIEEENEELVNKFLPIIENEKLNNIKIQILPSSYPQGSELQLIKSITGKEIKKGVLPINFGVIVSNVSTIKSIYDAVIEGIPLIERIVTISGEKIDKKGNYNIKIGTPIGHIVKTLEPSKDSKIIFGGPMMGNEVEIEKDSLVPTVKGTGGILFLSKNIDEIERQNCISCNACVDVCPMGLLPLYFAKNYEKGNMKKQIKLNIDNCLECGACEYVCPSRVPLIQSIKESKNEILNLKIEGRLK